MAMQNKKVASILDLVADYLEMDGVDFRTKAYRRAAHTVVSCLALTRGRWDGSERDNNLGILDKNDGLAVE
jgi:hypothetical protein